MAVLEIAPYKPAAGTAADAVQIANGFQAIEDVVNAIDNLNFAAGKIFAPNKITQAGASVGQALVWDGTDWVPSGGYSTSLPGSPADGKEHTLVDSITAPTYQWRFRYNAGSASAYKWEFVGGTPLSAEVVTQESSTSTTYVDLTTVGPSVTVPRAGDFLLDFGAGVITGTATTVYLAPKLGSAATADADAATFAPQGGTEGVAISQKIKRTLAASDVVKLQGKGSSGTWYFERRWLYITPVRVS